MRTPAPVFDLLAGERALLMSIPHLGIAIPDDIARRMTAVARSSPDTDFHLDRLYDFAEALGISRLQARWSRYVIDLNRPPDDRNLYRGADTTALVPVDAFDRTPLYRDGETPDASEIAARRAAYWQPYHEALAAELERLRARHDAVVLFDCHSIRSRVPRFFPGTLPDFNLGTADGASCDPALRATLAAALDTPAYTLAMDARFKGGYITRHYGAPAQGVHAFQLELSQATYMREDASNTFEPALAERVRPHLRRMLEAALDWVQP